MERGYDVKMSEVHGMSQRGGSVSTQVHWGEKVYSPVIGPGAADILVAFEKMREPPTPGRRPLPSAWRSGLEGLR